MSPDSSLGVTTTTTGDGLDSNLFIVGGPSDGLGISIGAWPRQSLMPSPGCATLGGLLA